MTERRRPASAIPVGTQFSPDLVRLVPFIRAARANSGNKKAIEDAVWEAGVRIRARPRPPTRRTKSLPVEAAVQYGLLERGSYNATSLADELVQLSEPAIYQVFARHILLNRGGLRVLEGIRQMDADGRTVTGDSLAQYLSDQGFAVSVHNTAINSLRLWLGKAGIFAEGRGAGAWVIDEEALEQTVRLSVEAIDALTQLTPNQRAFTEALCRLNPADWYPASSVRDLAETTLGVRLGRASLPKEVLEPLVQAGLITYRTRGTRGGKTAELKTTPKFKADVIQTFLARTIHDLDATIALYYKRRPEDIYADLDSEETFRKGRALEAYAIHVMRILGLRFVGWNKRAKDTTGRTEVDAVLVGSIGTVPTRWQVQCKNTPRGSVDADHVAKEVGLLPLTQATHIIVIANADVTRDARDFANQVMLRAPVSIFLLDRRDFEAVRADSANLAKILRAKASQIVRLHGQAGLFAWRSKN